MKVRSALTGGRVENPTPLGPFLRAPGETVGIGADADDGRGASAALLSEGSHHLPSIF